MTTEDIQALKASMRSALMGAVNSALRAESDDLPERWEDVSTTPARRGRTAGSPTRRTAGRPGAGRRHLGKLGLCRRMASNA